jgi:hypothetical protein
MSQPAGIVELRCPVPNEDPDGTCRPGRLFAQLRLNGEQPSFIHPDNLIVMACSDCRRRLHRVGRDVFRVLHCYDLSGVLIRTFTEENPGR